MKAVDKEQKPAVKKKVENFFGISVIWGVAVMLMITGCAAVGPGYVPPEKTSPAEWHTDLKDGLQVRSADPKILADWWNTLNDPILSDLIEQAVGGNLDLKQAKARVREARARRGISRTDQFPILDASGAATKSRSSENSGTGAETELYAAGFDAGWEMDIFGGVRRSVEAAQADLEASRADLQDVLVSLLAETALNYVEARSYQTRLAAAEANLKAQEKTYDLIVSRYEAGLSDELAVQQARYNLEDTRSQIPLLRTGLEAAQNRLAVLIGQLPGAVHEQLAERRPIPVTPVTVAVGVPADTLRRRPDIRRVERELAAQTARIGVATADLYPKFRLAGSIGLESLESAVFFESASRSWGIGPSFSWNIFDAGAIRQNIEVQSARQEQYVIAYEAAVLRALEEVENTLTAYAEEQLRRERLLDAVDAAKRAEELSQDQYKAGLVDFSNVLDAQRSLLSFEDQLAQSDGTVTSNLISLYKALGGGWTGLSDDDTRLLP
ncbi:MAG: efflux transporter outer membrane subunit [Thermodesulfobacteriota bacterium]|nr:efflux transporter outer membrane subunit [Thermodesulfobacteriota bacterium]